MTKPNLLKFVFVLLCLAFNGKVCISQMLGGNNAQQILERQQQHSMSINPAPPPTQADIRGAQERQRNGKPPELSRAEQMQKHVNELLIEAHHLNTKYEKADYYNSPAYLQDVPNYTNAITFIREMLKDKRPLSIKEAYYKAEAAFGNLHLNHVEYETLIKSNADFITTWLTQNKYNTKDPEALHYGIQKFMSDTLFITKQGKRTGHMPLFYDYIDVQGKNDTRNYFVTKTLATGTGQCHTFPVTYLILAEALGVNAYLAYCPRHSFIRYENNAGTMINYETTVDRFLADAFYLQTLPVMATAQKSKIYINNLNKRQVVATVLYDLASNFIKEHWVSDLKLIKECLQVAKTHFPDREYINGVESHLWKKVYAAELNNMVAAKKITHSSQIEKYPEIVSAYNNYVSYVEKLGTIGIQEYPVEEELKFLEYADKKGKLMQAKGIDSKQKRTLFIN